MGMDNLLAYGVEILRPRYGDAAAQIQKGLLDRMENQFFSALDKGDPVSLLQIQESAELMGECHLAPASDFAGYHLIFPFLPDIFTMCRKCT